ncbi:VOC family protein [Ochrobactrum sp. CM-21-5]|nr:VOC family protein [Ochrobactrum sp. CM-21-5]MBC2886092.1 VOC family protein [Ochrobactrum sp. CM-21-5]
MPIIALDHIQLAIPQAQEQKARDFYSGLLGFMEVPKPEELAPRGGCWFENGNVRVHLGVEHPFMPARKAHPGFLVDDLEQLTRQLAAAEVEIVTDRTLIGYQRCYISDPFGNRIELMQKIA